VPRPVLADPSELDELGIAEPKEDTWLYKPVGCVQCARTGFAGRVALYEVLSVQRRMRRLIESGSREEIFAEAVAQGVHTLRQDGVRLALARISSLDEVRRVTGDRLS
jgi:type II secretory ATPase GspE/PulE/Tfp pilus assembly ATPase PilB-like protein